MELNVTPSARSYAGEGRPVRLVALLCHFERVGRVEKSRHGTQLVWLRYRGNERNDVYLVIMIFRARTVPRAPSSVTK